MAKGKKTGGRNFQKGENGGPRGPDKVPRGYVVAAYRRFFEDDGRVENLQSVIDTMAGDPDYAMPLIRDMADRLDGKPTETVAIKGDLPAVTIILLGERRDPLAAPPEHSLPDASGEKPGRGHQAEAP